METLEFIIHPDGRVEERVTGIIGSSCAAVTAAIEAKLGIVASCELTSEHFAQTQFQAQSQSSMRSQLNQVSDPSTTGFSEW